jgi:hypothetical protein
VLADDAPEMLDAVKHLVEKDCDIVGRRHPQKRIIVEFSAMVSIHSSPDINGSLLRQQSPVDYRLNSSRKLTFAERPKATTG